MKADQRKLGSLLSYSQMFLSILIGMLYTPVMIRLLGKSEYGLYNTVASTISMLSILSLGFSSSYIRFYSGYKVKHQLGAIARLNGLFMVIFTVIGLVALGCGLFLSYNLELVFSSGLTASEYRIARILMILLSFNLGLSFPMSVFTSIISAHERFVVLKLLGMLKTVAGPLVTLPLLFLGYGSIALVSVALGVSLVTDLIYFAYVKKGLHCRFSFRKFEKGLFKTLLIFTSFIALNLIVDQVNTNIPKFLLGRFRGTDAVAVFSVGHTLYTYYVMFSTSVSGVFAPRVHQLVRSTEDDPSLQRQELTGLFTKVGRIQCAILGLVALGLVFFGRPFVDLWAGSGYEDGFYVALLLILPATVALMQNLGIEIQRALNRHKFRSIAYIFMAILNLVCSIFLSQAYGAVGAAVGTAFSLAVCNGLIMNIYYHKRCNIDILHFWKRIGRLCLGMLPALGVGIGLNLVLDLDRTPLFLTGIGIFALVYFAGMWFLGFDSYEKDLLRKPLKKLLRR